MSATQKFFRKLWAVSGTRAAMPDDVQADGTAAYESGYGFDYQRATGDSLLKMIERDKFNQLVYDVTLALQQYQTSGYPEFIATADNGGVAYSYRKNAYVYWPTDGNVYVSLVNANTSDPTDNTKWQLVSPGADVGFLSLCTGNPTTIPPGYLKANGSLLSRASYPRLWAFAQASNNLAASDGVWTKGQYSPGDGSTTFRIPDIRGYHPRYFDDGAGVDSGRVFASVQNDQNASHNHGYTDNGHSHGYSDNGHSHTYLNAGGGNSYPNANANTGTSGNTQTASSATGIAILTGYINIAIAASGGTETRVKTLAYLGLIKYQ